MQAKSLNRLGKLTRPGAARRRGGVSTARRGMGSGGSVAGPGYMNRKNKLRIRLYGGLFSLFRFVLSYFLVVYQCYHNVPI